MSGGTLTAIGESGFAPVIVVGIEGISYLLTDGDPSAAVTAWAGGDWSQALGGLEVSVNHNQRLSPWDPYKGSTSSAQLAVMDASGTGADTFGLLVFKREGQASTKLTDDVLPGDTTVAVRSTSAFASSGTIWIGCEAIDYSSKTATNFNGLTRGKWTPLHMESDAPFERTHRAILTVPNLDSDATVVTTVADAPLDWKGRWVAIYAHRNLGGGVIDTKADAHLLYAGKIATVRDGEDGRTVVQLDGWADAITDAVILREQWSARIRPVIKLPVNVTFHAQNARDAGGATTSAETTGHDLTVVASGAVTPNQINAGTYSAADLASAINDWLASEKSAGRLLFTMLFSAIDEDADGNVRSSVRWADPLGAALHHVLIRTNSDAVATFYGWTLGGGNKIEVNTDPHASGTAYSASEPQQVTLQGGDVTLSIEQAQGSFVDQTAFAITGGTSPGIVRIGRGLFYCITVPSVTDGVGTLEIIGAPINLAVGADIDSGNGWATPASIDGVVPVDQVLFLQAPFRTLVLSLLSSTGGGLNWSGYDALPEHCSAAIPYDLMGTGLEAELATTPGANDPMTVIVDKPTRLTTLLDKSTILRSFQPVWRQGRIAVRGFATPTSAATLTIGSDDRGAPMDTDDRQIAVAEEKDDLLRNVIKIRYGADAYGENYLHTTTIIDPGAAANYGARPIELDARNATRGTGIAGDDIGLLLPTFAAGLTFLSRPMMVVNIPIPHRLFETATAGEVCLFSDTGLRDPATGLRGVTARPALILANRYDWGGPDRAATGELELMIPTRLSLAPYAPCAQVSSYNAGTKVLSCAAHEHSPAGSVTHDAARFPVGSAVRVVQIDPATAAAPKAWLDVVLTQSGDTIGLTTGLAGYDAALSYRVIADDYTASTTAQRAFVYQADDADGLVEDARSPYGLTFHPIGQVDSYTDADPSTELPCRPPTVAYGDGKPLDVGHARDLARGCNSLVGYHGPQQPAQNNASGTYSAGTWTLVHIERVYLGIHVATTDRTIKLYVGPTVSKGGAASGSIRITLSQKKPRTADPSSPSRNDVVRVAPYTEHTFTTTSGTRTTMAAVGLDTSHLSSGHNHAPGVGWLCVEVGNHATFYGLGAKYAGPMEAP